MTQLVAAVLVGAALYLSFGLFVFLRQSGYVYYPDRHVDLTPAALGMRYEDLRIRTEDGETLGAWYVPAAEKGSTNETAPTVLHCHGNGGDIGDRVGMIKAFHDLGMNVLIFDYRGYGESTGAPDEEGTYRDAQAAWKHLVETRKIPPRTVVIHGQSLGGSVASWLAERERPGILVLESTLTSAPDMAVKMFPIFPVRLVCRFGYDSLARLKNIGCPVIIAHGPIDEVIPFSHGRRLFEAAQEPKVFVELSGSHNDGGIEADEGYRKILRECVEKYMKKGEDYE